jgi:hypothetical protein
MIVDPGGADSGVAEPFLDPGDVGAGLKRDICKPEVRGLGGSEFCVPGPAL